MRFNHAMLIGILICTSMIPTSVIAVTEQGLDWDFNTGDEFYFVLYADEKDGMLIDDEVIYIEANTTTPIPDYITNWSDIPIDPLNFYYSNGTQLGIEVSLLFGAINIELPNGNWTFLNKLADETSGLENFVLYDFGEPFFWGYDWEDENWTLSNDGWISKYSLSVHVEYFKIDGFLSRYAVLARNRTTGEGVGVIHLERLGIDKYRDRDCPTLNQPEDIEYVLGDTGYNITWILTDEYPGSYQIFKDGTEVMSGDCNSTSEDITIAVDGLEIGKHHYTIYVVDFRGNMNHDEVFVRVLDSISDNFLLIGFIAGAVVVILVTVVVIKRR